MKITKSKIQKIIEEELNLISEMHGFMKPDRYRPGQRSHPESDRDPQDPKSLSDEELEDKYIRRYGPDDAGTTYKGSGFTEPTEKDNHSKDGPIRNPNKVCQAHQWFEKEKEKSRQWKKYRHRTALLPGCLDEDELVERVMSEIFGPDSLRKVLPRNPPKTPSTTRMPDDRLPVDYSEYRWVGPDAPPRKEDTIGGIVKESDEDAESLESLAEEISHFFEAKLLNEKDGAYLTSRINDIFRGYSGGGSAERQKMNDLFDVVIKNAVLDYLKEWSTYVQDEEDFEDEE